MYQSLSIAIISPQVLFSIPHLHFPLLAPNDSHEQVKDSLTTRFRLMMAGAAADEAGPIFASQPEEPQRFIDDFHYCLGVFATTAVLLLGLGRCDVLESQSLGHDF